MTLKPAASLMHVDPRNQGIDIAALHDMVRDIQLNEAVPASIKDQFDVARSVFAYSWFVYEFTMLAEQHCYFVLEMALRHRLNPDMLPNTTKSLGLAKLLRAATDDGYLARIDFEIPSMSGAEGNQCQLDFISISRNHLAHGNINLLPQFALMQLELTAKILNKLFIPADR